MRGGQRPFGTFPKIHPFWRRLASLNVNDNHHDDIHEDDDHDIVYNKFNDYKEIRVQPPMINTIHAIIQGSL